MLKTIILFIIALLLYVFSPDYYSLGYCTALLVVYISCSLWFLKIVSNGNYFNFHVLFLLSIFFVNFVYPVFLRPIDETYFPVFHFPFNDKIITKSTAMVLVGIISYMAAVLKVMRQKPKKLRPTQTPINYPKVIPALVKINIFLFILFLIFAGSGFASGVLGSYSYTATSILILFQSTMGLVLVLIFRYNLKRYDRRFVDYLKSYPKSLIITLIAFILMFFFTGDRGPAIQLIVIVVGLYSLLKPIKLQSVALLVSVGMLVLTFISYARTADNSATQNTNFFNRGADKFKINSVFDLGMDLIVTNRNLYVAYEYVDKKGINYGETMLLFPLSIIPGLQSAVVQVFDLDVSHLSTAQIITDDVFGKNSQWGLGTNMIGDIYFAFGFVGVIALMFLLGIIIAKVQVYSYSEVNINYLITYIVMISLAVYLPRSEFLGPIRTVFWAIAVLKIVKLIYPVRRIVKILNN